MLLAKGYSYSKPDNYLSDGLLPCYLLRYSLKWNSRVKDDQSILGRRIYRHMAHIPSRQVKGILHTLPILLHDVLQL